jgi:hypothetical protein
VGLIVPPRVSGMNRLEADYALLLEARKRAGEVREYHYEALTLKLAHDTRYTPDFFVVLADGECELHETKGFFRDDSKVKVKVCARMYPFRVKLIRRKGLQWQIEEVKP